jgi:hypothetical protein
MKTLSLKVPHDLDAKLTALARRRRASKSAVIREALEELVGGNGRTRVGSAFDVVRDLVGCCEGPGDLSYNKKHLRDFGRR